MIAYNAGSGSVTASPDATGDPRLARTLARIDELLATLQASAAQLPPEQPEILVEETDRAGARA